ncbi:MAG: VWA domain-containing protein [Oscillospiraceae bacterium]|nr:VWA domain-containing protein [Oscillospiraceae bacterium]
MKKGVCFLLALLLIAGGLLAPAAMAAKRGAEKKNIAIVFDNSGSMYIRENKAWCRATYAMEVFAAMMNEGDTMTVYPMHEVTVNGKTYDSGSPVVISGPKNAEIIRNIYTPDPLGTPIETIDAAYQGLSRGGGEKWLIVLTDGDTFYENDRDLGVNATIQKLSEKLGEYNKAVNVMYLGIGANAVMPSVSENGSTRYYGDKAGDSAQVLSKLTYMCNMIFGRDTMPITDNRIDMDLSMKKVIIFVQGRDVSSITAANDRGEIGTRSDEHATKYSTLGAGGDNKGSTVDDNLQGMIVTYENCPAGEYTLSYSGNASSAVAYYEPDVDLVVQLVEASTGRVISGGDIAYAGDYELRYGLMDNQTGQLTESDLLGNTHYDVDYTVNGESFTASSDKKQDSLKLALAAGDVLDATIAADYLSGYHLEKDAPDFGWPEGGFQVQVRTIAVEELTMEVTQLKDEYRLSELESVGRFRLKAAYQGVPLTGETLASVVPNLRLEGGNAQVTWEPSDDGEGFDVFLKYAEGGAAETECCDYRLLADVTYTNEDGQSGTSSVMEKEFSITDDGYGLTSKLEAPQTFFRASEMDRGEPLRLTLAKDGEPLTDEELAAVSVDVEADGLDYEVEPLPGESALAIHLKNRDGATMGKRDVVCTVNGRDQVGREIRTTSKTGVEVQKYPLWMRWAVIGAILLLAILTAILIMNQKVLPKKVLRQGETDFTIGGKTIEDSATVAYNRGSKTLDITPPAAPSYPYVSCAVKLKLQAVSPRRIPSRDRQMMVTQVQAAADIDSVEVGAAVYERDKATGRFVKEGSNPTMLSKNSVITVNGTAQNNKGRNKPAILTQQLRFK